MKNNTILSLEATLNYLSFILSHTQTHSPSKKIISEQIQLVFLLSFDSYAIITAIIGFKVGNSLSKGQRGRWMLFVDHLSLSFYLSFYYTHSHSDSASSIHVLFLLCFCSLWYPLFPFT